MANSLIAGCIKMGMSVAIGCPKTHQPDADLMKWAAERGDFLCTDDIFEAAKDADVVSKALAATEKVKELAKEIEAMKREQAGGNIDELVSKAVVVNGVSVITGRFDMLGGEALRDMAEKLRDKAECSLVLLASGADDKVQLVAMASKSAVAAGVKCGNVIKQAATMCGGSGGGRPDMAQAGGKNVAAIDEMLTKVPEML
jgi:alanyl-tRNA synthetase